MKAERQIMVKLKYLRKLESGNVELLKLLKECVKYLDSGDYPENQSQRKLWLRARYLISSVESEVI